MRKADHKYDYDAIVVGSGPNGLAAAIVIQQAGFSVLLIEAKDRIGGGLRSAELTLPGFVHDVCSAIHPLAAGSYFFKLLPLEKYGLKYIHPDIPLAHPFDDGKAAVLLRSVEATAALLKEDQQAYLKMIAPLVDRWPHLEMDLLGPLRFPKHHGEMMNFGFLGLQSAKHFSKRFQTAEARALWSGIAAHSMLPLSSLATSAVGIVLMVACHLYGWPLIEGGSENLAKALAAYFESIGGKIQTGLYVNSLKQLPSSHAVLFDLTPRQLLRIASDRFSSIYKWQLKRYRYGTGVFKIDWALDDVIPFIAPQCRQAGTVHLGNSFEEIERSEKAVAARGHPERPLVLLVQPSIFDSSRSPIGKHTAWAYCHVPNNSQVDMTEAIENQVERFAPGFKKLILARHVMNTSQMEAYNENYVGGDINGGVMDLGQLFTRPALRFSAYKTSAKDIYICSSSAPPGGGVHGLCGFHAARAVLKNVFKINYRLI